MHFFEIKYAPQNFICICRFFLHTYSRAPHIHSWFVNQARMKMRDPLFLKTFTVIKSQFSNDIKIKYVDIYL